MTVSVLLSIVAARGMSSRTLVLHDALVVCTVLGLVVRLVMLD